MNLIALGINHNSASVEVRERVAFAPEQVGDALGELCAALELEEAVILSTCNRTELYAMVPAGDCPVMKAGAVVDWLAGYHHLQPEDLREAAYHHVAERALQHLVQVAAAARACTASSASPA